MANRVPKNQPYLVAKYVQENLNVTGSDLAVLFDIGFREPLSALNGGGGKRMRHLNLTVGLFLLCEQN